MIVIGTNKDGDQYMFSFNQSLLAQKVWYNAQNFNQYRF